MSELGFPAGDGRTGGRVGERGAHWQLSLHETKRCRVEAKVKDPAEDLSPLKVDTSPHPVVCTPRPSGKDRWGRQTEGKLESQV